jgi:quercetin dioxygenase-like cupin family protein
MTNKLSVLIATFSLSACAAGSEKEPEAPTQNVVVEAQDQSSQEQIRVRAGEGYKPCPPTMAITTCEMAVLNGDPRKPGLFTMRIRAEGSWVIPPHAHPRAGQITVLSGDIHYGLGASVDKSKSETFSAGDYYVSAPGTVHYTWADAPVEIQITGNGPWESHAHK